MNKNITFHDYKPGEENEVSGLVRMVFDEFVAPCYVQEGISTFIEYIEPAKIAARIKAGDDFVITAKDGDQIVGVIDVKQHNHISLLYVDKKYHDGGIAKRLLQKAIERIRAKNPKIIEITVNSSLYGVLIYERMGFRLLSPEQEKNGIKYFPMSMRI